MTQASTDDTLRHTHIHFFTQSSHIVSD